MPKFKLAVVGITGDPPTLGHAWLAETADSTGWFDEVWLMPCNDHTFGKQMESPDNRLTMTRIMTKEMGERIIASEFEIENQLDGSCYETCQKIKSLNSECDITWVVGLDNASQISKWRNAPRLFQGDLVSFLVCNRPDSLPPSDPWYLKSPHRYVEGSNGVRCSSSDFKKLLAKKDDLCRTMVTPGVWEYIVNHHLYGIGD
jgi:nicotinate (nicotinamide) nucleotide adenylyltransferase